MCSACQPDGLGAGSESCSNCGGWQAGCVGVVPGVLGMHSCEVGEWYEAANWEAEGWLFTPWAWKEETSVRTMESLSGSTAEVAGNACTRVGKCICV